MKNVESKPTGSAQIRFFILHFAFFISVHIPGRLMPAVILPISELEISLA
jgi:hypothetical protein